MSAKSKGKNAKPHESCRIAIIKEQTSAQHYAWKLWCLHKGMQSLASLNEADVSWRVTERNTVRSGDGG